MYEGKLVRLRAFEQSDIERSAQFVNDYQTVRTMVNTFLLPSSMDDERQWLSQQSSYTRGEYQFAVETLDGLLIGRCGLTRIDWKNRIGEIGIMIGDSEWRGRGCGTEAVKLLCKFAFEEMNLNKLRLGVFDFNPAGIKCYEKCGFVREGCLRQEVFREGAYHDVYQYGLLASEFVKA